jgi:hypothetical protein
MSKKKKKKYIKSYPASMFVLGPRCSHTCLTPRDVFFLLAEVPQEAVPRNTSMLLYPQPGGPSPTQVNLLRTCHLSIHTGGSALCWELGFSTNRQAWFLCSGSKVPNVTSSGSCLPGAVTLAS